MAGTRQGWRSGPRWGIDRGEVPAARVGRGRGVDGVEGEVPDARGDANNVCFEYGGGLLHQEQRASGEAAQRVVADWREALGFGDEFRKGGGAQLEVHALFGVYEAHAAELKEALRKGQGDGTLAIQVVLSRGDEA